MVDERGLAQRRLVLGGGVTQVVTVLGTTDTHVGVDLVGLEGGESEIDLSGSEAGEGDREAKMRAAAGTKHDAASRADAARDEHAVLAADLGELFLDDGNCLPTRFRDSMGAPVPRLPRQHSATRSPTSSSSKIGRVT